MSGRLYYQKNNGEIYSVSAARPAVCAGGAASAGCPPRRPRPAAARSTRSSTRAATAASRAPGPAVWWRSTRAPGRCAGRSGSRRRPSRRRSRTGGRIYVGSQDGTVYCLLATSGRIVWRYMRRRRRQGGRPRSHRTASSSPRTAASHRAARGQRQGGLAQSSTSGRSFGRAGNFYGTPAVHFGRVYASNTDGRVYSFAASSGKLAWSHSTGGYRLRRARGRGRARHEAGRLHRLLQRPLHGTRRPLRQGHLEQGRLREDLRRRQRDRRRRLLLVAVDAAHVGAGRPQRRGSCGRSDAAPSIPRSPTGSASTSRATARSTASRRPNSWPSDRADRSGSSAPQQSPDARKR